MSDEQHIQSPRTAWILHLRAEALRMRRPEVSAIAHVGIVLATFADWDGTNAFPGVDTLAVITGRSEDTVSRCLKALADAGLIERKRRQGGKNAVATLLTPLGRTDWEPLLLPFSETRQAAYRRREKARKAAEEAAARAAQNPSPDGLLNPSPSGDQEPVPVGGSELPRTRPRTGQEPVRGRVADPVPVGGVRIPSSTSGRDTHTDREMPGLVAQPQVGAREACDNDEFSPGLQALDGGGRGGGGGQSPLLLSVHSEPAAPPDLGLIADHMSSLYGVVLPRRYAAPVVLQILGDLDDLPDPTAYVVAALDADPDRYRPTLPSAAAPTRRAAASAS